MRPNTSKYIVELQSGRWLRAGQGDPPWTLFFLHARRFTTEAAAKGALTRVRKKCPRKGYKQARIVEVPQ